MKRQGLLASSVLGCLLGIVIISLSASAQSTAPNQWAWMNGSNIANEPAVFGTLGVFAPGNTPGSRSGAATWTDNKGNFWLFGGSAGYPNSGAGVLDDLWEFNPATNQWAWMSGGTAQNSLAIYTGPGAAPGGREGAFSWADSSGNLWLLGGEGVDGTGDRGQLGDLWKFDPSTSVWTFVGGGDQICASGGNYGTQGKAASGNFPGCRSYGVSWTDQNGNFWLFGGQSGSDLNDLWEYNKSSGEWAWMNGSDNEGPFGMGAFGVYGTLGIPSAANTPGARVEATGWTDKSGHLWLFGGEGNGPEIVSDSGGYDDGTLNDLWEYDPSTNEWTWMSGSSSTDPYDGVAGVYGTLGVVAANNVPWSRWGASSWTDSKGNFWLFGGCCFEVKTDGSYLDDLWVFDPNTKEWGWMNGSNLPLWQISNPVVYGVLGVAAEANVPGARVVASSWTDANGNLWLFGGQGADGTGGGGTLSDVWEIEPSMSATYQTVPTPTFSPGSGNYQFVQPKLSDADSYAGIYYTLDGTAPTGMSTLYFANMYPYGFPLNGSPDTVRAIALQTNYYPSAEADATYNITLGDTATIAVTPASSSMSESSSLSVSIAVSGAASNPTPTGTVTLTSGSYASAPTTLVNGSATINIPANSLAVGSDTLIANYSGDLTYDSGAGNAAITVTAPPSFTVGGTAVTVAPGATTANTSTITLTPTGGFTGNIALTAAITSGPTGAQYPPTVSFGATTPVAITGTTAGTATLTISTTAATTSAVVIPKRPGSPWYAAGSAALAFVLFIGNMRRRSAWRTLTGMLVLLGMLAGGVIACGNGGSSNSGGGGGGGGTGIAGTTAGTYTVTVTGTSGTVATTGTVTVTVQ